MALTFIYYLNNRLFWDCYYWLRVLLKYSCIMPSQPPLALGAENLSCTHLACPGTPRAPHPAPCSGAQGPTTPSDPSRQMNNYISLGNTGSLTRLCFSQDAYRGHKPVLTLTTNILDLSPNPEPQSPLWVQPWRGEETGGKGPGAAERKKHHCRVCGHLLLTVVLDVLSPLVAVGVCIAESAVMCKTWTLWMTHRL